MGLPIWRSPPPSPRPAAAALCDAGPSRSAIRRRISPRTSPRDGAHRFVPVSRGSRSTTYSSARSRSNIDALESQSSHAMAVSLSSLNARLNDLQESAISLRNQHRHLLESQNSNNEPETVESPAIMNDYGVAIEPDYYRHIPLDTAYERAISRYQGRLVRARQEIQRLESEGLQLNEQRRRLSRLHTMFYNRHLPYSAPEPPSTQEYFGMSRTLPQTRDDSEPVPQILSVPERFTSSPQPMIERLSSGAVRAASTSSSSSAGPEMELPPLRRMGHRDVGDRSPDPSRTIRAYSAEEMVEELQGNSQLHDGLGDRDRSVESDAAEENWNTMLSTIAPDERLPSASSSFASEAASRSFSAGSNNSSRAPSAFSSRTTITVPEETGCDNEELWRSIGDRFSRGQDVPDEMWESAGVPAGTARILSRSMRERL